MLVFVVYAVDAYYFANVNLERIKAGKEPIFVSVGERYLDGGSVKVHGLTYEIMIWRTLLSPKQTSEGYTFIYDTWIPFRDNERINERWTVNQPWD